jgi:hypothetical protein
MTYNFVYLNYNFKNRWSRRDGDREGENYGIDILFFLEKL